MTASDWIDSVRSAAVVGTDRRHPPTDDWATAELGVAPHVRSPDRALLDQAAVATAALRAGRSPSAADPISECPPESSPYPRAAAVDLLGVLVDAAPVPRDLRAELIRRWLRTAASADVVVPPDRLPTLVALASGDPAISTALQAVWGRRGSWLADVAHLVVGSPPLPDADALTSRWDQLGHSAAVDGIVALRETDPTAARDIARAHWSAFPAADKERIAASMEVGLSPADEQFLESVLDERSVRAREAARRVLTMLPDSSFAQRMAARLAPLIAVDRHRLRTSKTTVTVQAPTELDDAARRDGLTGTESAADATANLRAIVRSAPLSVWEHTTSLRPDRIVAATADDPIVHTGLLQAVKSQAAREPTTHAEWVRALVADSSDPELIGLLPASERDTALIRVLLRSSQPEFAGLLASLPRPWSPPVAIAIIDALTTPGAKGRPRIASPLSTSDAMAFGGTAIGHIRELLAKSELPHSDIVVPDALRRVLAAAITFDSLDRSIQEAFT